MRPKSREAATKLDLYKIHAAEYTAERQPILITTKPAKYLSIAGSGRAGNKVFTASLAALYAVAFTVKGMKKLGGRDYKICKLEGQWWSARGDPDAWGARIWNWKLMIRKPDFVQAQDVKDAVEQLAADGRRGYADRVVLEVIDEGECVQALHVGPYSEEGMTIERMKTFAAAQGKELRGVHHEIYLSDPRRVPPARLRTILRHPVA